MHRRADAPTVCGDELLFVKPLEEERLFGEFLDFVTAQDQKGAGEGEVWYAQTRKSFAKPPDRPNPSTLL